VYFEYTQAYVCGLTEVLPKGALTLWKEDLRSCPKAFAKTPVLPKGDSTHFLSNWLTT